MDVQKITMNQHWYCENLDYSDSVYNVVDIDIWKMCKCTTNVIQDVEGTHF